MAGAAIAAVAAGCLATSAAGSGQPPQCYGPSQEVEHNEVGQIHAGCWDPEYDTLTITVTQQPQHGTLTGPDSNHNFRFQPDTTYTGPDEFRYTVTDGTSDPVAVTARITVAAARDDAPYCSTWSGPREIEAAEDHSVYVSCSDDEGVNVALRVTDPPDHGTVSGPDQYDTFVYRSDAGYSGDDSITFVGNDGGQDSPPVTARLNVIPARNDPPSCYSVYRYEGTGPMGSASGPIEGGEKGFWFAQCSDDEGDKLTPRVTDPPEHGTAEPSGSSVVYTAGHGYAGPDGFKFVMSDGVNDSQEQSVSLEVREATDDPPQCGTPKYQVEQGDVAYVQPYCTDDEGAKLTYEVLNPPSHGTIGPDQWGGLVYTPEPEFVGIDEYTLRVRDGVNTVDVAIPVKVIATQNDPPSCFLGWSSDSPFFGGFGTMESGDVQRFQASCFDDENDAVRIEVTKQPQHGTLAIAGEMIRYTADSSYTGSDGFAIRGHDGRAYGAEHSVSFNIVAPQDDPPRCVGYPRGDPTAIFGGAGRMEVGETNPVRIQCHDDEGVAVTTSVTQAPAHGTVTPDELGDLIYAAEDGFTGRDEFKFKGSAGPQESSEVTIAINVVPAANDAPSCFLSALRQSSVFGAPAAESGETAWFGASCSDDEGDAISFEVTDQPDHGQIELVRDRPRDYPYFYDLRVAYTPEPGYTGPDSFKLGASDGTNQSNEMTTSFQVGPASDDPPGCSPFAGASRQPGKATTIDLSQFCPDDEGEPLEFEILRAPAHGTLTGPDSEGRFTYTADAGYEGDDELAYTASDGTNVTKTQKFKLYPSSGAGPACRPDKPLLAVAPGTSVTLSPSDLCEGDLAGHLVEPWMTPPAHGSLVSNSDGSVTFTPAAGFSGTDTFGVRIHNGKHPAAEASLRIVVGGPPNGAPTCADTSIHVLRDTVTPVPLPCDDPDGDALRIQRVPGSGPSHGRLGPINPDDRRVVYKPSAGFLGEDLFRFTADDGIATSASALARLIVVAEGAGRDVTPGESVSTGESASSSDPLIASVTSPVAGRVAVFEGPPAASAPAGYSFLGQQVSIQAPRATVEEPLRLVFEIAASLLPPGGDDGSLKVFRNGVPVAACSGPPGHASPTPCVAAREQLPGGNLRFTILTVEASRWNLGSGSGVTAPGSDPGPQDPAPPGPGPSGPDPSGSGPDTGPPGGDTQPPGGPPPGDDRDTAAPRVVLKLKKDQKLVGVLRSGLSTEAGCSEACVVSATLALDAKLAKRLGLSTKVGTAKLKLTAAGRRNLVVKLSRKASTALARSRRVTLQLSARATDPAGNAAAATPLRVTLVR